MRKQERKGVLIIYSITTIFLTLNESIKYRIVINTRCITNQGCFPSQIHPFALWAE